MSNTQKRILSAFILVLIVLICSIIGPRALLILSLVVGMICVDEVYVNFFKQPRMNIMYFINQSLIMVPFLWLNIFSFSIGLIDLFVNIGLALNLLLLVYVFKVDMKSKVLLDIFNKYKYTVGLFFLIPIMSISSILHYSKWGYFIGILLCVNFGMDIGAWFFGKNFGKNKLWPSVSPNKTIEGLLGGILVSCLLGSLLWWSFFSDLNIYLIILFGALGGLSQIGDLIQSKLKRQCDIKDSSRLIPGHGGFYDRIDSLLFVAPFFTTALRYI